jgi:hypothetical protein
MTRKAEMRKIIVGAFLSLDGIRYLRGGKIATGSFQFEKPTEAKLERGRNLS